MNQNIDRNTDELPIGDFTDLLKKIFYKVIYAIYRVFNFYWKNKWVILALVVVGVAIHLLRKEFSTKIYNNSAIVIQNFETADYLYYTIENINDEIGNPSNASDLKRIFGPDYQRVRKIEIEPIDNFYNFNDVDNKNREDFNLFTKSKDVSVNIKEYKESIYFKYHKVIITIKDNVNTDDILQHFFAYINGNSHYKAYGDVFKEGLKMKEQENIESIHSIDSLISSYVAENKKFNQNINISNSSDIHLLYEQKDRLLNQNLTLKTKLVDYDAPIKPIATATNQPVDKLLPTIILYPFLLVLLYSLIYFLRYLFKKSIDYQGG